MEYIIITMAVLAGTAIGYVNGRRHEREDNKQRLHTLEEALLNETDTKQWGWDIGNNPIWCCGAIDVIERLLEDG